MRIFAVSSGKGGTGKSCVAAYTASALAKQGKKVLLAEAGAGFRALDLVLNVHDKVLFDLSDVLSGRCELSKAIVETRHENLFLLPGPSGPLREESGENLELLLKSCKADFDVVIADAVDFTALSPALFDAIWLVVTPDSLAVRAAAEHAAFLYREGAQCLRLIMNATPARLAPIHSARDFDDIIDMTGARLLGVLPHSPLLSYCAGSFEPLGDSLTAEIFENIAARVLGEHRRLLIH